MARARAAFAGHRSAGATLAERWLPCWSHPKPQTPNPKLKNLATQVHPPAEEADPPGGTATSGTIIHKGSLRTDEGDHGKRTSNYLGPIIVM